MQVQIISIECGLGNQMFQYAFYLNRKDKAGKFVYYLVPPIESHNGYELDNIFDISNNKFTNLIIRIIKKVLFIFIDKKYETSPGYYVPNSLISSSWVIYYCGFWQSEKYFKEINNKVKEKFKFKDYKISFINKLFIEEIKGQETVSIHVRRGDYETHEGSRQLLSGLCTLEYYTDAIKIINNLLSEGPRYFIFSDDLEWCRLNLVVENAVYVDWNRGENSWQDMMLMSHCKHNIIANSSFSWWGAYLNDHEDKIVICPKRWLSSVETPDITPEDWIKV